MATMQNWFCWLLLCFLLSPLQSQYIITRKVNDTATYLEYYDVHDYLYQSTLADTTNQRNHTSVYNVMEAIIMNYTIDVQKDNMIVDNGQMKLVYTGYESDFFWKQYMIERHPGQTYTKTIYIYVNPYVTLPRIEEWHYTNDSDVDGSSVLDSAILKYDFDYVNLKQIIDVFNTSQPDQVISTNIIEYRGYQINFITIYAMVDNVIKTEFFSTYRGSGSYETHYNNTKLNTLTKVYAPDSSGWSLTELYSTTTQPPTFVASNKTNYSKTRLVKKFIQNNVLTTETWDTSQVDSSLLSRCEAGSPDVHGNIVSLCYDSNNNLIETDFQDNTAHTIKKTYPIDSNNIIKEEVYSTSLSLQNTRYINTTSNQLKIVYPSYFGQSTIEYYDNSVIPPVLLETDNLNTYQQELVKTFPPDTNGVTVKETWDISISNSPALLSTSKAYPSVLGTTTIEIYDNQNNLVETDVTSMYTMSINKTYAQLVDGATKSEIYDMFNPYSPTETDFVNYNTNTMIINYPMSNMGTLITTISHWDGSVWTVNETDVVYPNKQVCVKTFLQYLSGITNAEIWNTSIIPSVLLLKLKIYPADLTTGFITTELYDINNILQETHIKDPATNEISVIYPEDNNHITETRFYEIIDYELIENEVTHNKLIRSELSNSNTKILTKLFFQDFDNSIMSGEKWNIIDPNIPVLIESYIFNIQSGPFIKTFILDVNSNTTHGEIWNMTTPVVDINNPILDSLLSTTILYSPDVNGIIKTEIYDPTGVTLIETDMQNTTSNTLTKVYPENNEHKIISLIYDFTSINLLELSDNCLLERWIFDTINNTLNKTFKIDENHEIKTEIWNMTNSSMAVLLETNKLNVDTHILTKIYTPDAVTGVTQGQRYDFADETNPILLNKLLIYPANVKGIRTEIYDINNTLIEIDLEDASNHTLTKRYGFDNPQNAYTTIDTYSISRMPPILMKRTKEYKPDQKNMILIEEYSVDEYVTTLSLVTKKYPPTIDLVMTTEVSFYMCNLRLYTSTEKYYFITGRKNVWNDYENTLIVFDVYKTELLHLGNGHSAVDKEVRLEVKRKKKNHYFETERIYIKSTIVQQIKTCFNETEDGASLTTEVYSAEGDVSSSSIGCDFLDIIL